MNIQFLKILLIYPNDSAETEANKSNSQSLGETIPEVTSQVLPKETKVSHDYIIAQDFIQEVTSGLIDEDDIQVIDGNQEKLSLLIYF
jgi:hypothetical protein